MKEYELLTIDKKISIKKDLELKNKNYENLIDSYNEQINRGINLHDELKKVTKEKNKYKAVQMAIQKKPYKEITKETGVKHSTIPHYVKKYVINKYSLFQDKRIINGKLEHNRSNIINLFKDEKAKSLRSACKIINSKLNIEVSHTGLNKFLIKYNLKDAIIKKANS